VAVVVGGAALAVGEGGIDEEVALGGTGVSEGGIGAGGAGVAVGRSGVGDGTGRLTGGARNADVVGDGVGGVAEF
jgi:hypothetical protein